MSDQPSFLQSLAQVFRDHGPTAAITAMIGGALALAASVTRKAFTSEAMLDRLERELAAERARAEHQRSEDRAVDAARLERIEIDLRAVRELLFEAFQRGRAD